MRDVFVYPSGCACAFDLVTGGVTYILLCYLDLHACCDPSVLALDLACVSGILHNVLYEFKGRSTLI